jgi:ATP-dependent Zn protease
MTKTEQIAYHEAAHAVAAIRLRRYVYEGFVTIVPQGAVLGQSHIDSASALLLDDPVYDGPEEIEAAIVELLAGYFGSVRAGCQRAKAKAGSWGDDKEAADLLELIGRKRSTFRRRAERFVEREWSAIVAVAQELLAHETLDMFEVSFIADVTRPQALVELAEYRRARDAAAS